LDGTEGHPYHKPGRLIIKDGETVGLHPDQQMYAPNDAARVYNNWISNGFDRGDTNAIFGGLRKTANGMTMLKLGLSAFHATTMAQEAVISEIARGVGAATRGDALGAGAAIAKSPGAFVARGMRGGRMQRELLAGDGTSPASRIGRFFGAKDVPIDGLSQQVNDAFIRAGGRVRMDKLYRTRGAGSFYNAIADGTWKAELKDTASKIFGRDRMVVERAGGIIDAVGNVIQTVAAPLFEAYIPRLKQGAFASNMEDWLKLHPNAGQSEIDAAAHLINRSIDNRFGEMAWDNLFWHRYLKQASQMTLLSPTWNLGTHQRDRRRPAGRHGPIGQGAGGGQGRHPAHRLCDRAGDLRAADQRHRMTYLKTGSARGHGLPRLPHRRHGRDQRNQPERAMLPGYQKDVYAFGYDFPNHIGQEVDNKLNPAAADGDRRGRTATIAACRSATSRARPASRPARSATTCSSS
jgi:hypothetical protein